MFSPWDEVAIPVCGFRAKNKSDFRRRIKYGFDACPAPGTTANGRAAARPAGHTAGLGRLSVDRRHDVRLLDISWQIMPEVGFVLHWFRNQVWGKGFINTITS